MYMHMGDPQWATHGLVGIRYSVRHADTLPNLSLIMDAPNRTSKAMIATATTIPVFQEGLLLMALGGMPIIEPKPRMRLEM